jgi:hypothetical protein
MFNRNKKRNPDVERLHVGVFEIRLSAEKVEIETKDKTWKQVFAHPTRPWSEIVALCAARQKCAFEKDVVGEGMIMTALFNIVYACYGTQMFCYYPSLCNTFLGMLNEIAEKAKVESDTKVEESNTTENEK